MAPTIATAAAASPDLAECVQKCSDALTAADRVISLQADTIKQLDDQNWRLNKALEAAAHDTDEARSQLAESQAWYRQPSFIAPASLVLGIVVGGMAVRAGSR